MKKQKWKEYKIKVEEYLAKMGFEIIDGGTGWIRIRDTIHPIIEIEIEPDIFKLGNWA